MDKRKHDRDIISKMYDIVELVYILNRLTDEFYEDEHSKQYLLSMMDDMQNVKYSIDKYRSRGSKRSGIKNDSLHYSSGNTFIDKIIFYLKSLNEE